MEVNKILDKQIFIEVVFGFILLAVILVGGFVLYNNIKGNGVLTKDDLVIDFNDKDVPSNLYAMSDGVGLKTNPYIYSVTNNGKKKATIIVSIKNNNNNNINEYLRIAIDDIKIVDFSELEKTKNDYYILYEDELEKGETGIHKIKIWLNNKCPNGLSGLSANFSLNAEIK